MLPSECPYPETNPEHPATHPLGSSQAQGHCNQCQRYFRRCPDCRSANRWLARFCRNCGHALTALNWLPELADNPFQEKPFAWPLRWSQPIQCGFIPRWMALLDGRAFLLGPQGELRCYQSRLDSPYPPLSGPVASSPSYLHGFLAIPGSSRGESAGEDQITLVDLLEARPGGGRRIQRLRGPLLCPLASDQGQWLAALVHEGDNRGLQLFRLHQGRLQLSWNQVIEGSGPDSSGIPRLFWLNSTLVYLDEHGQITGLDPISGTQVFQANCPSPPNLLPPWVHGSNAYWGGNDGSLWWLRTAPEVQLHQLSGAQTSPMLALAAGPNDVLASYGRSLQRVRLENGRCEILDLPQYCTVSPWVGQDRALALSQEGQLYLLSLGSQTFQVVATDKMPLPFGSTLLPPLWTGREWLTLDQEGHLFSGVQTAGAT